MHQGSSLAWRLNQIKIKYLYFTWLNIKKYILLILIYGYSEKTSLDKTMFTKKRKLENEMEV